MFKLLRYADELEAESEKFTKDQEQYMKTSFKCQADRIEAEKQLIERNAILNKKIERYNEQMFYLEMSEEEQRDPQRALKSLMEKKNN